MSRWYEHKIPPPVIDLAVGLLMWALARAVPAAQLWPQGAWPFGVGAALGIALAGGLIALAGAWQFRRARTTINPLSPAKTSAPQAATLGHSIAIGTDSRRCRNTASVSWRMLLRGCAAMKGRVANTDQGTASRSASGSSLRHSSTSSSSRRCW